MHVRKDDLVVVIAGDDKGPEPRKVLRALPEKNKVVVEGVNRVYRHLKPNARNQQGGRLSVEMPIDVSNVMLYNPFLGRPVRVGFRYTDGGQKERYCKLSGQSLGLMGPPKPKWRRGGEPGDRGSAISRDSQNAGSGLSSNPHDSRVVSFPSMAFDDRAAYVGMAKVWDFIFPSAAQGQEAHHVPNGVGASGSHTEPPIAVVREEDRMKIVPARLRESHADLTAIFDAIDAWAADNPEGEFSGAEDFLVQVDVAEAPWMIARALGLLVADGVLHRAYRAVDPTSHVTSIEKSANFWQLPKPVHAPDGSPLDPERAEIVPFYRWEAANVGG